MFFRRLLLILCFCLWAAGCRRNAYRDAYFDMLNAEKRVLEDRLYAVEDEYLQAKRELDACRSEQGSTAPGPRPAPRPVPRQPASPRVPPAPPAEESDFPEIELPPGFESGTRHSQGPALYPASLQRSGGDPPAPAAAPRESTAPRQVAAGAPASDDPPPLDRRVASIYLHPHQTGGIDLDGQPGDDGLSVLIEPRNELGQSLAEPGQISLVLLDPLRQGEAARVARWDFDRQATARMLSADGRGVHVCVPWPERPPQADRLHLFVKYVGQHGDVLQADREIPIRSMTHLADRWTPRAQLPETQTARRDTPPSSNNGGSGVVPASHQAPLSRPESRQPVRDQLPQWRPER